MLWVLGVLGVLPWLCQGDLSLGDCQDATRRIHVAAFASELDMIQSAVFASTSMVFGEMALLDYGRGAEWPRLTVKLRAYRDYVERMLDSQLCDFVLFLDAYDAVVTGTEREIMDRVLALEARTGKPILFGAETAPDKYQEAFEDLAKAQNVSTPWRYLNSGLMVGRVWALRIFLRETRLHGKMFAAIVTLGPKQNLMLCQG